MGRNVGKRACWAGDNRHVYSKYYTPSTKKERDGQAWLEEKQKRRGVSNCHGIALRRRRRRPTQSSAGNKQLGWISQQKKRKENPCSQRAARLALINNPPPTNNLCAPHTSWSPYRVGKKNKTKTTFAQSFTPKMLVTHVFHSWLSWSEKERAAGNSRRFHFVRVLCIAVAGKQENNNLSRVVRFDQTSWESQRDAVFQLTASRIDDKLHSALLSMPSDFHKN